MIQGFIEYNLGVGHENYLRFVLRSNVAKQYVYLFLAQYFQVCIWFINEQHATSARIEICKDQQHLLKTTSGERNIKMFFHISLLVRELNATADSFFRFIESNLEKTIHQLHDSFPVIRSVIVYEQTQILQNLRCLSLPQQNVDASRLKNRFFGFQSRHRIE